MKNKSEISYSRELMGISFVRELRKMRRTALKNNCSYRLNLIDTFKDFSCARLKVKKS